MVVPLPAGTRCTVAAANSAAADRVLRGVVPSVSCCSLHRELQPPFDYLIRRTRVQPNVTNAFESNEYTDCSDDTDDDDDNDTADDDINKEGGSANSSRGTAAAACHKHRFVEHTSKRTKRSRPLSAAYAVTTDEYCDWQHHEAEAIP
eukprot:Lankesteria_metandrocarpae@DN6521_c0_g1_i1.p1